MKIGGNMAMYESPGDPIFWSHHAYIDRIWSMWQDCHGYDEMSTAASGTCASAPIPCKFPQQFSSAADWDREMPFFNGGLNAPWGSSHPTSWDSTRKHARDYQKIHDLGAQSYMYEMDDFDKHMHNNAATCQMDWHGFDKQQNLLSTSHETHFANSAAEVASKALPLNLDESAPGATGAFSKFYKGGMCGSAVQMDATKPDFSKTAYLSTLQDVASRECSALASGLGALRRVKPFPEGRVLTIKEARAFAGVCGGVAASAEIVDDTVRMNQAGRCEADRLTKASCELTDGEWVSHSWTGADTGANKCNLCKCNNGLLSCTKKDCAKAAIKEAIAAATPKPVVITKIEYTNCPYQTIVAATCSLKNHAGGKSTIAVAHNQHKCRMVRGNECECEQRKDTTTGVAIGVISSPLAGLKPN